jgi:osmotically-inducible protein OsmY
MKTDRQIKEDIIEELQWAPNVTETDIGVTVHEGVVTLTGTVPNFAEKYSAERAAFRVEGVRAVAEEIKVKFPGSSYERDDTDVASAVSNALDMHVSLPSDLKAAVEDGRVTLKGTVNHGYLRDVAYNAVRYIRGVRDVNNHILVRPSVQPKDVKARIKSALKRIAEQDADEVQVEAAGSKVVLTGKVRSLAEMEDIKWAAWAAPGVSEVQNRMSVSS